MATLTPSFFDMVMVTDATKIFSFSSNFNPKDLSLAVRPSDRMRLKMAERSEFPSPVGSVNPVRRSTGIEEMTSEVLSEVTNKEEWDQIRSFLVFDCLGCLCVSSVL